MPTVLITGANRGLGFEFATQYAADDWRVIATCRRPDEATALRALAGVEVAALDVADFDAVQALAEASDAPIDVLLCNAGVYGDRLGSGSAGPGQIDYDAWATTFRVNTMAPLRLAECFADRVAASDQRKIVAVTSKMGSIADNGSGGSYLYRSSKAALNMAYRSLAHDLAGRQIAVGVLHPGWVATDMGGAGAPLQAPESVRGMRAAIDQLSAATSGRFWNHDGSEIPW